MSARERLAPLVWWTDTLAGVQWTALDGHEVRVWKTSTSSGAWAKPWRVGLFHDDHAVGFVAQCKSEDGAKASAEKRLRKAAT